MPAKHDINIEAKLLITTWEGVAADDELIESLKNYQINIQNHSDHSGFNEIVDLTKITNIKVTLKGLKTISSIALSTDNNSIRSKLAFIVSSKRAFSLVKLYSAYRSLGRKSSKEINVFTNEKDAFEWASQ